MISSVFTAIETFIYPTVYWYIEAGEARANLIQGEKNRNKKQRGEANEWTKK